MTQAKDSSDWSLLHAPPLAWPTIGACLALDWLAMFGPPGVHLPTAWHYLWFAVFAGASLCLLARARRWNLRAVGLVWKVEPSGAFWLRTSAWMAGVIGVGFAAAAFASRAGADPFGLCAMHLDLDLERELGSLVHAPLVEEVTFRLLLCAPLVGRLSSAANIALSGIVFTLAHWITGGLGPDSVVGGFFLAWAFLRSGTILVPIAMHALGNAALDAFLGSGAVTALACGAS